MRERINQKLRLIINSNTPSLTENDTLSSPYFAAAF